MAAPEDLKDPKDKSKPVPILVNNRQIEVSDRHVTALDIKQAAGIPESFHLYGPKGEEIANDETIKVHNKERFTAISGQDVS